MQHRIILELELNDREYRVLARLTAGVLASFQHFGTAQPWTLQLELEHLIRQALRREGLLQDDRDRLALELGAEQARLAAAIGVGDDAPAAPAWLVELMKDELRGGEA